MKHLFLFFLFIILVNIVGVMAVGFSPSSLIYELEQNEEECKMIILSSDSETITVSDKWAENESIEWKVSLFDTNASYHGINISYDNELSIDEREVEVCLSGERVGEYHGVILLREEQKGNTITQMGIWLKVIITKSEKQETPINNENNEGGSGGGGGSKNTPATLTTSEKPEIIVNENNNIDEQNIAEDNKNIDADSSAGITGAVIGGSKGNWKIIGIVMAVIIIAGIIIYMKRNKEYKI